MFHFKFWQLNWLMLIYYLLFVKLNVLLSSSSSSSSSSFVYQELLLLFCSFVLSATTTTITTTPTTTNITINHNHHHTMTIHSTNRFCCFRSWFPLDLLFLSILLALFMGTTTSWSRFLLLASYTDTDTERYKIL